jgi:zinc protease
MKTISSCLIVVLICACFVGCSDSPTRENFVLKNGLRVVLEHRDSPITSAAFVINGGEAVGDPGLMRVTVRMLLEGTEVRTKEQMYEDLDLQGGKIEAQVGIPFSYIIVQAPTGTFSDCFNTLCECLTKPAFDQNRMNESLLQMHKSHIPSIFDESVRKGQHFDPVRRMLFTNSPYGRSGWLKVSDFSRDDVARQYKDWFVPSNMVLSITGKFNRNEVLSIASSLWETIEKSKPSAYPEIPLGTFAEEKEKIIESSEPYDRILIGFRAPEYSSDQYFAVKILESFLASGPSSYLPTRLREIGLSDYNVHCSYFPMINSGYFVLALQIPAGDAKEAKSFVFHEIDQIKTMDIPEKPLQIAVQKLISRYAIHSQTTGYQASYLGAVTLTETPKRTPSVVIDHIQDVPASEIQTAAKELFVDPVVWISQGKS